MLKSKLETIEIKNELKWIYVTDETGVQKQIERINETADEFKKLFGENREMSLFSAPGRIEIGGNHTDHQGGNVLAASINLDVIGVASKNDSDVIRIKSSGFVMDTVNINELDAVESEKNQAISLIRGIAYAIKNAGHKISGFDMYTTSNVLKGSGMSSSAAFEVLIGTVINDFYCNNALTNVEIAMIGQFAENEYFGKPCGLMDQSASSVGNLITINFKDSSKPIVKKINYNFSKSGYSICIIDTLGDHSDLTDEYAAIPHEMKEIAKYFNKDVLSQVDADDFYENIGDIRKKVSERAVLRAVHFFNDNECCLKQVKALKESDFEEFKNLITKSGYSSFMYLQNVYTSTNVHSQPVSVALAMCERLLSSKGAYRVHGGGFAGTIQAFVPIEMTDKFKEEIEKVTGEGTCHILSVRPTGGIKII